jgi:hypothetical protein
MRFTIMTSKDLKFRLGFIPCPTASIQGWLHIYL